MSVCHHREVGYLHDQAPGAPIRSGIPEHGRIPKCHAVKAHVSVVIGELGEGGMLPTERDLAVRYEVSRETVRQALRELLLEGRLARQGRGAVVAARSARSSVPPPSATTTATCMPVTPSSCAPAPGSAVSSASWPDPSCPCGNGSGLKINSSPRAGS